MTLSLNRANSVAQFINNDMLVFPYKSELQKKLTPVGRGLIDAKTHEDASDRKVVFKFQFASELFGDISSQELTDRTKNIGTNP